MSQPPSGTVTFLFTDVEGSTKLAQQYPDRWEALRARHQALLHQAMQSHHGYVFQIIGDAFCVAFHTAVDALNAAVLAQRLLHQEPWDPAPLKVRIGISTGTAHPAAVDDRSGGYTGYTSLARVQRVMALAQGGQTLLSQSTHDLVRDALPSGLALRDLGEHRLKDLQQLEHLYQLDASGLPSEFPPLPSVDAFPNNLPVQLTTFVGRTLELAEVKRLLMTTHLLTLTGSGGTGKTRLALQLAAEILDTFANGVWLVELAPIADATLVTQTIASTLEVRDQPGRSILDALLDYVRAKQLLLLLDNCEHLIDTCAQLAETLLRAAPRLRIVASSREALGIAGEVSYRVPSLSIPDGQHLPNLDTLSQNDCIRLFMDRARAVSPRFQLTEKNAPALAEICARLDGIPLAIELAAARTRVFPPDQIALRLDDRFRLLTGGSRTALPRQQTLGALIDWSYELLSEAERTLLQGLSVFAGGWSLDGAQAICSGTPGEDVLQTLTRLVDKSLVVVDEQVEAGEARYHLLETIRQYARDKLLAEGQAAATRDRHLEYFVRFAEEAEPKLRSREQLEWLERVEREHDNLRAALGWSLESGKREAALRLAGAAYFFWYVRGYWSEGQRWLDGALALDDRTANAERSRPTHADTARRAKALYSAAVLGYTSMGVNEAVSARMQESLRLWRALGDPWWTALVLKDAWQLKLEAVDLATARAQCEESVALARQTGDKWLLSYCLTKLGLAVGLRDLATVRPIYEEALAAARAVGDKAVLTYALVNLAGGYFFQGDYAAVVPLAEETMAAARAIGSQASLQIGLGITFAAALGQRQLGKALDAALQLQTLANETGSRLVNSYALMAFSALAAGIGQPRRGAQLAGAVESLYHSLGIDINASAGTGAGTFYKYVLQSLQAQLDAATFNATMAEGRALTLEQALALADEIRDQAARTDYPSASANSRSRVSEGAK